MAKKVVALVKLQIPAGKATPAPPVGPALGQHGVNIMDFCKSFNAKTQGNDGLIIPPDTMRMKSGYVWVSTLIMISISSSCPPYTRLAGSAKYRVPMTPASTAALSR